MKLGSDDLLVVVAHLLQITEAGNGWKSACPFCESKNWSVEDILYMPTAEESRSIVGQQTVPHLMIVCKVCFHVRHFAWKPIQAKAQTADFQPYLQRARQMREEERAKQAAEKSGKGRGDG